MGARVAERGWTDGTVERAVKWPTVRAVVPHPTDATISPRGIFAICKIPGEKPWRIIHCRTGRSLPEQPHMGLRELRRLAEKLEKDFGYWDRGEFGQDFLRTKQQRATRREKFIAAGGLSGPVPA